MKHFLIVVDMQNDFIYGKFFNKNAQNIVNSVFQEINYNTVQYDKIIFTKDSHENDEFITVSPNKNKEPNLVLIKGVKNAKPFLKMEKNLYIYELDGTYTEELKKIYNK